MDPAAQQHSRRYLLTLSLGALGVVYGDIGTSPLYAFRECFAPSHGLPPNHDNILGVLSLICWSLILVISFKYLVFVMRADNRGEGGILALMSLVRPLKSKRRGLLIALGLFGSSLLYGDGIITPAITVLSAIEGLEVVTPFFTPYVVPITIGVLIVLFAVQKFGTAKVGAIFGPVMIVWFVTISAMGIYHIVQEPRVLAAVSPHYAVLFFLQNGVLGWLVLGSVFLVVTGGEALYADMGHFGPKPIRIVWFSFVFPALMLNYLGQGAFLLHTPEGATNPFFLMAPSWTRYPLVVLSTVAASIASQAVISGAYSLTRQAVQLGYLPRMRIHHTSAREIGQIYIPSINWILMFAAIALVLVFRDSGSLAAAYGVSVTTTMMITTILLAIVERERWRWKMSAILSLTIPFLLVDFAFFSANIIKVPDGGWFPLSVGVLVYTLNSTWRTGRRILTERLAAQGGLSIDDFLRELSNNRIPRVPGTAIFMSRNSDGVPTTLLHNIKHNKVVHQRVVLLTVETEERSHLAPEERYEWSDLGHGVYRLILHFGFMEDQDLPEVLATIEGPVSFKSMMTSYFLGRETLIPTKQPGMAIWREHLFAWMMRNSSSASGYFNLPANQVIELGAQVEL